MCGYLDAPTVDVLGGGRKRLIYCRLEAQVGMAASDSERPLEIERHDSRERPTSFPDNLVSCIPKLYI